MLHEARCCQNPFHWMNFERLTGYRDDYVCIQLYIIRGEPSKNMFYINMFPIILDRSLGKALSLWYIFVHIQRALIVACTKCHVGCYVFKHRQHLPVKGWGMKPKESASVHWDSYTFADYGAHWGNRWHKQCGKMKRINDNHIFFFVYPLSLADPGLLSLCMCQMETARCLATTRSLFMRVYEL